MPFYSYLYRASFLFFFSSVFCLYEFNPIQAQCTGSEIPTSAVTSNYNGNDVSCAGVCDGEITITMTGGSLYGYQLFHQNTGTFYPGPTANDFQASNVFNNLCQGDYDVTVLDSAVVYIPGVLYGECSGFETISGAQGLTASFLGPSPPSCKDSCDGSVFINSTGGNTSGFIRYEMPVIGLDTLIDPNGVRFLQVDDLCSGNQSFTVTDVNGCTVTETENTIVEPTVFYGTINLTDALCNGDCNGSAVATGVGGNGGPFSYLWDNVPSSGGISNTNTANGLCENTSYTLHMEDNQNCPFDTTFSTVDVIPISIGIASTQDASCSYSDDGVITITVNGGTGNYTSIQWFGGSNIGSGINTGVTGLTNNSLFADSAYYVVVTDDNNCTSELAMPLLASPGDIQISGTANDILCNGDGNGNISITVSGGNGSLTPAWTMLIPGSGIVPGDEDQTGLSGGTYKVVITDDNGCQDSATYVINEPLPITTTITVDNNTSCNGIADGGCTVVANGGTVAVDYNYLWDDPSAQNTASATNLAAGSYTVTVTDDNGCNASDNITISEADQLYAIPLLVNHVSCNGLSDGSATSIGVGGTVAADYNFLWDDAAAQATSTASNLAAGTYTITITDDNGCSADSTIEITQPNTLTATQIIDAQVSCFGLSDGQATVNPSGGTNPYTYLWDDPTAQTTATATGLSAGTYTCNVTDNGSKSWSLNYNEEFDGAIGAEWSNNTTYSFRGETILGRYANDDGVTLNLSALPAHDSIRVIVDFYSFNSLDGNNTNWGPDLWTLSLDNDTLLHTTFSFPNGQDQSYPDEYNPSAVINNPGGSSSIASGTSPRFAKYILNVVGLHSNNTANIDFSGFGLQGLGDESWGIDNVKVYLFSSSGLAACQHIETVIITEPNELDVSAIKNSDVTCFGGNEGSATGSAIGGTVATDYIYSWNDPAIQNTATATGLVAGTYQINITDDNGCEDSATVIITEPNSVISAGTVSDVSCSGLSDGAITLNLTGGTGSLNTTWTGPPGFVDPNTDNLVNIESGTYQLNIVDDNGCIYDTTFLVVEPTEIITSAVITNVSCNGAGDGSIDLSSSGGSNTFLFDWDNDGTGDNDDNEDLFSIVGGTYCVSIIDQSQPLCQLDTCFTITESSAISITETITNVDCNGDSTGAISLVVTGGVVATDYNYNWIGINSGFTSNNGNINNLIADQYSIVVTDDNGCSDSTAFSVTENNDIIITSNVNDANCGLNNGSADVSIVGGVIATDYNYSWKDNLGNVISVTNSINNVGSGIYQIIITDDLSCSDSTTVNVNDLSGSTLTVDSIKHESCAGGNDGLITVLTNAAPPPGVLTWVGPVGFSDPGGNNNTISNLSAGQYIATLTDGAGCTIQEIITINQAQSITLNGVLNDPTCFGSNNGSIDLFVSGGNIGISGSYIYDWDNDGTGDNDDNEDLSSIAGGDFTVTVFDDIGCSTTQTYTLNEPTEITGSTTANVIGCGMNDGTASVIVNGGTVNNDYTYLWTDIAGNQIGATSTITSQPAGCYNISVTDDNGCEFLDIACINNPTGPIITLDQIDSVTCFGGTDGNILLTINSINNPTTFNWQTVTTGSPTNGEDLNNINAGTYSITATDNLGCVSGQAYTVEEPNDFSIISSITNLTCNNDSTGDIDLTISGGTPSYNYNWTGPNGFSSTIEDISNLIAGSYQLSGSDNNGCLLPNTTIDVNEPNALALSVTSTSSTCGNNDGSASVTVTGGTVAVDYNFSWIDLSLGAGLPSTTSSIINIAAGIYRVIVSDDNGCLDSTDITISDINGPTLTAVVTQIDCNGNTNGEIDLTITGTSSYTVDWDNDGIGDADDSEDLTNLAENTYIVTVNDLSTGCVSVLSEDIIEPDPMSIGSTVIDVACNGSNDGEINLTLTGGTSPYQYDWDVDGLGDNDDDDSIFNLSSGNYHLFVTDDNGCIIDSVFTLSQPLELTVNATISNNACSTDSNGVIELVTTGGVGGYLYNWSSTSGYTNSNDTILQLHSDTFNLSLTDGNLCQLDTFFVITSPSPLYANITLIDANCGFSDGSATANPFGGTVSGNYIYDWDIDGVGDNDDSPNISNLLSGTYSLTVIDDNNCTIDTTIIITNTSAPQITVNNTTDPTCHGGNDGSIDISVSGGNQPYQIYWNPNQTSQTSIISNLFAGDHIVHVIDAIGCEVIDTINLNEPNPILIALTLNKSTCQSCNGTASAVVSGGNPSAIYNTTWSNGNTGNLASGLCSGIYTVSVSDNNGCSKDSNFTISDDLTNISLNPTLVSPSCSGGLNGSISLNPSGGISPYNYLWINNGSTSNAISNLSSGEYSVLITDDNGCTEVASFLLSTSTENIDLSSYVTPADCNSNNGNIKVIPSGGTAPYTYSWSNNSVTDSVFNLSAGIYTVNVTDNNGCSNSANIGLPNFNGLTISTVVTNVACFNDSTGSISATISGNTGSTTNTWFDENLNNLNSGAIVSNLSAGNYMLQIIDDINGCYQYEYISIKQNSPIKVSLGNTNNASCDVSCDGGASLVVFGGSLPYNYLWGNSATTPNVNNLCAGLNNVLITDSQGCNIGQAFNIEKDNNLTFASSIINATCGSCDGIVNLTAIGGSGNESFTWFDGIVSTSHPNLCAGVHGFELVDNITGCSVISAVEINDIGGPDNSIVSVVNPTCFNGTDGSASVTASGGTPPYNYNWIPSGQNTNIVSGLSAGLYHLEVLDNNNCRLVVPVSVANPSAPIVEQLTENASCGKNNGAISLVVYQGSGSYIYSWTGPNGFSSNAKDISNLEAGVYELTISDINGCSFPYTFTINSENGLIVDLTKTDISCFGINDGSISSTVTGGSGNYGYLWSTNSTNTNINNLSPGLYSLTVTDANTNCVSSNFIELQSPDSISISTPFILEPSCFGQNNGLASVSISGGNNVYSVNWTGLGVGFNQLNLSAGNYPITVTDQNNCTTNGVVRINQPDSIQIIVDQIINAYCVDQSDGEIYISVIGGISPYSYSWINTVGTYSNNSDQDINNLLPGNYVITIIDQNLCSSNDTVIVDAQNTIIADAGVDSNVCVGGCLNIIGSGFGSSVLGYSWNIVDSANILSTDSLINNYCFNDTNDIQFVLSVTDQSCIDKDTITISVNPLPVVDAGVDVDDIYGANVALGGLPTGPFGSSFVWSPSTNFLDPNDSTISNPDVTVLANQTYSVTVTDLNGCQNSDDINITLIPDISFSSGFSPNNDGINDTWSIDQIGQFPNCNVEIYNRWGTLLFKSVGYSEKWTGLFNEKPLPIGTYYFVIELNDPLFPDPVTGPVTIIR